MDLQLAGKRALVTGSTAGIGLAIAQAMAAEGAEVWVNGRTAERVSAAVAQVKGKVHGVAADLGTVEGCRTVIEAASELDVLVNNVGVFAAIPFAEIGDEEWQRVFDVNVMSGVRLSRHHLPRMIGRGWGRILFVSSESALQIPAEMIHYGVTKTAQVSLARGMAETTAGTGVTVNSILPGPTKSEGVGEFVQGLARAQGVSAEVVEQEFFRSMRPTSLLKRFEKPEEIAALAVFVASPRASGINGAALRVDGGVVRAIA